jgi:hypothetical protein
VRPLLTRALMNTSLDRTSSFFCSSPCSITSQNISSRVTLLRRKLRVIKGRPSALACLDVGLAGVADELREPGLRNNTIRVSVLVKPRRQRHDTGAS